MVYIIFAASQRCASPCGAIDIPFLWRIFQNKKTSICEYFGENKRKRKIYKNFPEIECKNSTFFASFTWLFDRLAISLLLLI